VADGQYTEIHDCTFYDGHEEFAQPSDPMPRDESILGGGVVDGHEEGNRVEGKEEEDVREFNIHRLWPDEARWTRRVVSRWFPAEKRSHSRKPRSGSLGGPKLQKAGGQTG
jgi:hypothetical protein